MNTHMLFDIYIYKYIYLQIISFNPYEADHRPKFLNCLVRRHNQYDGIEEFWIIVKESGERSETHSFEERHQKTSQA